MFGFFGKRKGTKTKSEEERKAETARFITIVSDFGQVLEENSFAPGGEIRDVKELPHPKNEIQKALSFMIMVSPEKHIVEAAHAALLCLADYQEGIGDRLHLLGETPAALIEKSRQSDDAFAASVDKIAESYSKYQEIAVIVEKERKQYDALARKLKSMF